MNSEGPSQKGEVDNKKLYEILGVEQNVDTNEIKRSYKKACVKGEYRHPDKGGDPEKFKLLNEAYEVLSNPEKKDLYDKYGMDGLKDGGMGGGGGFDLFDLLGGGGGRRGPKGPVKAKPKLRELKVTLEEVYQGKMFSFEHKRKRTCTDCDGKGGANATTCTQCKGRKMVEKMVMLGPGMYSQTSQPCPTCKAEGVCYAEKDRCKGCKGQRIIDSTKTVEVAVEPGVPDQNDYIFTGESDEAPGIIAGDLYVRIMIEPHPVFKRKGADLYIEKKISLLESLTGTYFTVNHLDGTKVIIATAPGEVISPNTVKVVKGKGMPFYKDAFSHGNLYI